MHMQWDTKKTRTLSKSFDRLLWDFSYAGHLSIGMWSWKRLIPNFYQMINVSHSWVWCFIYFHCSVRRSSRLFYNCIFSSGYCAAVRDLFLKCPSWMKRYRINCAFTMEQVVDPQNNSSHPWMVKNTVNWMITKLIYHSRYIIITREFKYLEAIFEHQD